MFKKVLIANRGEVAIRIHSTLERLGIASAGVYTHSDRNALHVERIHESYYLDSPVRNGYLDSGAIIAIALESGAEAIHPGYGFLAENSDFAQTCQDAGLTFIGPAPQAMRAMGEKISAKEHAMQAGVPVVPGVGKVGMSDEEIIEAAATLKFPLLVKPAAGGGGKGLHITHNINELREALVTARREAKMAFGDDTLFVESYLLHARHIEFQVVADNHGNSMHLGERECSLQRRHQKVIEEAPAILLSESNREIMGIAALALTDAIGYQNLGTVEFLVDGDNPEIFYFMEMNTRLQVEHRITELVTGLDLVECQIRLASSELLSDVIPKRNLSGHAIEARIYSEDAFNDFLPTGGFVGRFAPLQDANTVVDSAISDGTLVTSTFDPMLAKISCWGESRDISLNRLQQALSQTVLLGVTTNIDFLIDVLNLDDVKASHYNTAYLESSSFMRSDPPTEILNAYASITAQSLISGAWTRDGWRLKGSLPSTVAGYIDGVRYEIPVQNHNALAVDSYFDDDSYWLHHRDFGTWHIKSSSERASTKTGESDEILSPMPGVVIAINVNVGDLVNIGDSLLVIEAMKMELIVRAKRTGHIKACNVECGTKVRVGQLLLEVVENV